MSDSLQSAVNTAGNILSYSPRSRAALVERLVQKGVDIETAALAAERLAELGLLDDLRYARALVASYRARGYGPAHIRRALAHKLIENEDIEAALEDFEPSAEKIEKYISSRLAGRQIDRKLIKKVTDGLYRRGFAWDDISAAMRDYLASMEEDSLG